MEPYPLNQPGQALLAAPGGNRRAAADLMPAVYDELRRLAACKMARERSAHTLQPTALVHEAYLRLLAPDDLPQWSGRTHFFAAAAEAMRRILIESARRKQRLKHGGGLQRVDIDTEELELPLPMPAEDLLVLDDAVDRLGNIDTLAAQVVELCFFGGFTQEEAAQELGLSLATVERRWSFARAWLFRELRKEKEHPEG